MASVSGDHVRELLASVQTENVAVRSLLDSIVQAAEENSAVGTHALPAQRPEITVPECYQVVVECRDEADQRAVFDRMRAEGYRCRVLTL
jgi:hypothetical protein